LESIAQLNGEAFSKEVLINCILVSWQKAGGEVHKIIANRITGKNLILFNVIKLKVKVFDRSLHFFFKHFFIMC